MKVLKNDKNFEGIFDHGKKMGNGYFKFPNGDLFYGFFENDILQGVGTIVFKSNPKFFSYWGDFVKNEMKGSGIVWLLSGEIIEC